MSYSLTYIRGPEAAQEMAAKILDMDQSKLPERLRLTPEKALRWATSGEDKFARKGDAIQKAKAMAARTDCPCLAIRVRDIETCAPIFEHGDMMAFYAEDFIQAKP